MADNSNLSQSDLNAFSSLNEKLETDSSREETTEEKTAVGFRDIDPMLASKFDGDIEDVDEDRYFAEVKFDGTRLVLQKFDGQIRMFSRTHKEYSDNYPQVIDELQAQLGNGTILDGELAFVDENGKSHFLTVAAKRDTYLSKGLRPVYIVFDVIMADGDDVTDYPIEERKDILEELIPRDKENVRVANYYDSGFVQLYDRMMEEGREGIIIKKRGSPYRFTRSVLWKKIKAGYEADLIVVGYTEGEGRRKDTFGALVLVDGEGKFVAKVGTGFSDAKLEELTNSFVEDPDSEYRDIDTDKRDVTFVEPFLAEIKYLNVTEHDVLRMPVFERVRRNKPLDEADVIEQ